MPRDNRFNLRFDDDELALIRRAAALRKLDATDYMRSELLKAAERDVAAAEPKPTRR